MLNKYINPNINNDNNTDDDIDDAKLMQDAKQLFQNFTNLGRSSVNVTLQTITSISNDMKLKYDNTITSINSNDNNNNNDSNNKNNNNEKNIFTNIVSNIGLTEAEQNAKKFLTGSDSTTDARPKKRLVLSLKELQSFEKRIKQENAFDDIVKFAKTKSR